MHVVELESGGLHIYKRGIDPPIPGSDTYA